MNLRNFAGDYSIGLDMGTASVGWAVTDGDGELLHFNKKPTWGSRLFEEAMHASEARVHRGQRRRYARRRWRLNFLQELFRPYMEEVDSTFFMRLNHSRTIEGDPIFAEDFTKKDYYDRFPTIYHLRTYLMETGEQADLRLIYLAMHNIVKHRGNFLRQGERLSAKTANTDKAIKNLNEALETWSKSRNFGFKKMDEGKIAAILAFEGTSRSQKAKDIASLILIDTEDAAANKKTAKALANATVGLQSEFKDIFGDFECDSTKLALSDEEKLESLQAVCPDDCSELLDALCGVYSAYVLQGLLSYAEGKTISYNMVAKYDQYAQDLKCLKSLVREYAPRSFDGFFRGATRQGSHDYDVSKVGGYTAYDLHKLSYDDFAKRVKKLLGSTAAAQDERYQAMMDAFDKQRFLRRLKTSDNGSIYYQLHLEELQAIIRNQGRFYPFLKADASKLESLVTFRIPYYVGPLTSKNAPKDKRGNNRFQWSERKPGMEEAVITPWNWENVIDKNASAEKFVLRMTGDCAYLAGERVLPKQSLLYEEFCVLNELNGVRWSEDGDTWYRFDAAQREGIIYGLFHNKRRVTYRMIEDWLVQERYADRHPIVKGGQGNDALESKMGSYIFFAKDIFGVQELGPAECSVIEQIILWKTIFEDRSILKEKLEEEFGSRGSGMLDAKQIKAICNKKRFTGWGRLSEKFLTGVRVNTQTGRRVSIMDVLREGNPNSDRRLGGTMVLMEALHDENLGFQHKIDELNHEYFAINQKALGVNELPGSPAIRRSLNQAIRIVDEIAKIAGHAPANVFIEVTHSDEKTKKGKRTTRRWDNIEDALKRFKEEGGTLEVMEDFKRLKGSGVDLDERLTLYLMQNGKCLYSNRSIDLQKLLAGSGDYEVDHIIPRAYIKDDSLDNKALVYRDENQRKTDEMLINRSVRSKMSETWRQLHDAKLMSDKKYRNLQRSHISGEAMKGFIARQLVETSQMVKMTQTLLEARYDEKGTRVVPVKASVSHELREVAGLVKCREANDFHHAHDAYLACRLGLFIQQRYPMIYEDPIRYTHVVKKLVRMQMEQYNKVHWMPLSASFIVGSFMRCGFDRDTGEVFWDADTEVEGIRRVFNYRQCYITRMPYEDSGAFWDANPISKRRNPKLRLKRGLEPAIYGGYNNKKAAYFFIYEVEDSKGSKSLKIAQMPIYLKGRLEKSKDEFEAYCSSLECGGKTHFTRIVIPRLLKWQLVKIGDNFLQINAEEEMKPASEIAFSQEEMEPIARLLDKEEECSDSDCEKIYEAISRGLKRTRCQMLIDSLDLDSKSGDFSLLPKEQKEELLLAILLLCKGGKKSRPVDLSSLGGSKSAGRLRPARAKVPDGMFIIDQSVTGMFERGTRVGL